MFGFVWVDKFGSEPSDTWIDALAEMSYPQVSTALTKVRNTAMPYPGWLPSLPEVLAFARSTPPPQRERNEPTPSGTWVDSLCGVMVIRWTFKIGQGDAEQSERMKAAWALTRQQYNELVRSGVEVSQREVGTILYQRFAKVLDRPELVQQMEPQLQALPGQANANSLTRNGHLTLDEP
jgi:hypothetical protein